MTYKELYKHNILAIIRAPLHQISKIGRLFLIAGTIFIISNLVFSGFFLDSIIKLVYPDKDSIYVFNSVLIYLFAFDLFFRSLLQKLPKVDFIPYLILPVSINWIIRFLISKSFLSFFNFYLLFLFIPFLLKTDLPNINTISVITYCAGFILLIVTNQLLINILNSVIQKRFLLIFFPLIIIVILIILRFYFYFPIGIKTMFIGNSLLKGNFYVIALQIFILISLYLLNKISFKMLISSEIDYQKIIRGNRKINKNLNILADWGIIGEYMRLELFMILRNKRTRQNIYYSMFFIFYSILFLFTNEILWNSIYVKQIVYLTITGIFALFHGQFILSWESSFFDFIQTYNITFKDFLKAKYYLFIISNFLLGIILLPVVLIMKTDLFLFISILIFNTGVTNFLIIYNSIFNSGKIDLARKAYANWQGTGPNHFLIFLVIVGVPLSISYIIRLLVIDNYIYLVFILTGGVVTVFHNRWIDFIAKKFRERKYSNLENYRN